METPSLILPLPSQSTTSEAKYDYCHEQILEQIVKLNHVANSNHSTLLMNKFQLETHVAAKPSRIKKYIYIY